ncbi:MAG TPA: hypothetical protein VLB68_02320 [Pyrinomonadaceae bacterium]|nr:hypothetical protein [Pyrinomonadaceae bacterium]
MTTRRVSINEFIWPQVFSNHGASTYKRASSNRNSAHDRRIRAYGNAFFDKRFHRRPVGFTTTRIQIVGEDNIGSKKNIVGNMNMLPNADAILDGDVVAYPDARLDKSVVADITVFTDDDVSLNVGERPDTSAAPDALGFYKGLRVYKMLLLDHVYCRQSIRAHATALWYMMPHRIATV